MRRIQLFMRRVISWTPLVAFMWVVSLAAVSCSNSAPDPTPAPRVIEKEVVVTATPPTPGPTQTPVVMQVVKRVEVVVTPTPPPAAPTQTAHPVSRTVMDDVGREIEIPYRPQRVAVTNSWMVELLMACEFTPAARPQIPLEFVYPPAAYEIPVISISHSAGPNLEQLASVQPDLVLTSSTYGRFAEPIQQSLGAPVLVYDVDDVLNKIDLFGSLVGCSDKAQQAAAELRAKISQQQRGLPEAGPEVFGLFGTSESFLGFTSTSYPGDMVSLLGGSMIADDAAPYLYRGIPNPSYAVFSLENVVERDPNVILVVRHGSPNEAREENFSGLYSNPAWAGLRGCVRSLGYVLEWRHETQSIPQ